MNQARCLRNARDLFAAGEAEPQGEGPTLTAGEGSKVRRLNAVYHSVRVLAAKDVHGLHARSPEIAVECEFLLKAEI